MNLLDYVLGQLDASDKSIYELSKETGLPQNTIRRIARRETTNPTVGNVQALYDYFHRDSAA